MTMQGHSCMEMAQVHWRSLHRINLAQQNVDGTPNLIDRTPVLDWVKKQTDKNDFTYSKRSSLCTVGPSSSSNSDTESGTNMGKQAKLPVQAKVDETPILKDKTPLMKHARLTRSSSLVMGNN